MQIKDGHSGAATIRDISSSADKFSRSIRISSVCKDFLDATIDVPNQTKIVVKIDTEGHE